VIEDLTEAFSYQCDQGAELGIITNIA